jgi:hypothetical protein
MAPAITRARADLGFAPALDDLDLSGFAPRPLRPATERPAPAVVAEVAAAAGFRSREPKPAVVEGQRDTAPRRRRTGRSVQFNLKARPETVAAYAALADRMGWGLAETLEHAVTLLEREFGRAPSDP